MALISIKNDLVQSLDTLWAADGTTKIKLGIGTKGVAGQDQATAWQGVATHVDGASYVEADGVVLIAGSDGSNVRKLLMDANGLLMVTTLSLRGGLIDRSGTMAEGGTSQEVAATSLARLYFLFQNASAEDMWLNFGVDAVADSPSIKVEPGGSFELVGPFQTFQSVNVVSATTASKYTAKEGLAD